MEPITVVIADDIVNTREDVKRLLFFEEDIKVVGEAGDGEEAVRVAEELRPDIVLMDINMPGLDGITATEIITERVPQTAVVIISIQGEQEYIRKAMAAGASDYLLKPFTSQELADTIRRVNEKAKRRQGTLLRLQEKPEAPLPGKVVVLFGTKGGVGRTTLACNLAVALAQEFHKRVTVVDLDLAGADVALLFNLNLAGSIAELAREPELNREIVEAYTATHLTGVKVLGVVTSREEDYPDLAARLPGIFGILKEECDLLLVDTPPVLNAAVAQALDMADEILVVGGQDLPALKRLKADVEFLKEHELGGKVRVVLNAFVEGGLKPGEMEKTLGSKFTGVIAFDVKTAQLAANKGTPFVLLQKGSRIAQDVCRLAEKLLQKETVKEEKRSLLGKILSF